MNKSITRTWLVINLALFIYLIYMAITAGFEHSTTIALMIICAASSTLYLANKMGFFKKGGISESKSK